MILWVKIADLFCVSIDLNKIISFDFVENIYYISPKYYLILSEIFIKLCFKSKGTERSFSQQLFCKYRISILQNFLLLDWIYFPHMILWVKAADIFCISTDLNGNNIVWFCWKVINKLLIINNIFLNIRNVLDL